MVQMKVAPRDTGTEDTGTGDTGTEDTGTEDTGSEIPALGTPALKILVQMTVMATRMAKIRAAIPVTPANRHPKLNSQT